MLGMYNHHMLLKWIFDRTVSLFGLLILWPFLLVIAVLIKMTMSGGPVFFKQKRIGKDGKPFTIHKFRSMIISHSSSTVSVAGDDRYTSLGAVLRKYKIDELPELWDVLIGNMSFVGPRPDVSGYADKLEGDDRVVLKMRPGITGPATLKYRHEDEMLALVQDELNEKGEMKNEKLGVIRSIQEYNDKVIYPDKVGLNRYYYHHYSFIKDIQMIICTVFAKKMIYAGEEI